jgi:hypothetical protein
MDEFFEAIGWDHRPSDGDAGLTRVRVTGAPGGPADMEPRP